MSIAVGLAWYAEARKECEALQAEIARLRLTDAEREAVERAADLIDSKTCGDSSTLRGLLERTAKLSESGKPG